MFRNFLISAFRNLVRNKFQSIIQILSLALGLTVFCLISIYTYDELSIDRPNENLDQIYRVEDRKQVMLSMTRVGLPLGPIIERDFPEIRSMTRILYEDDLYLTRMNASGEPGKQVHLKDFMQVDSGFLEIFPQRFILGDPAASLRDPDNIVLTESIASELFGTDNPVGRTIYTGTGTMFTVSAVIKDPLNTHLKFQALGPVHRHPQFRPEVINSNPRSLLGGFMAWPTYITIHRNADPVTLEDKIEIAWQEFCSWADPEYDAYSLDADIALTPLRHVHFSDVDPGPYMTTARKNVIKNFLLLGIVILFLGIINYVNLATARASLRAREVSLKKIIGATRIRLILYFLTESFATTLLSFLVAVTLVQLIYPQFIYLLQADINLYFMEDPLTWVVVACAILFISILAGIYPAFQISSGKTLSGLQKESGTSGRGLILRRGLMVLQFSSAIILMIGIMVIHIQIIQMKKQDLGFETEHILWTSVADIPQGKQRALLKERLIRYPEIVSSCLSTKVPGWGFTDNGALYDRPGHFAHGMYLSLLFCEPEFFSLYDLEFVRGNASLGRNSLLGLFTDTSRMATARYMIINESMWKASGIEDPVGYADEDNWVIRGVVKDFHFQTLEHPIRPLGIGLYNSPGRGDLLSIRVRSQNLQKTLRQVEKEILEVRKLSPKGNSNIEIPVKFEFIDETFNRQYQDVQRVYNAYVYFFILAMIIACLGLFGLSTFMAQRRTKEIGIRKTMGSSERQVFMLLAVDFTKWISISVVIGCIAGWYLMRLWQQQFAFVADIGFWIYPLAAIIAFGIAFLTVAWQSLKTARTNPVESLRYE